MPLTKALSIAGFAACLATSALADPLPSWSDGAAKERIVAFVDSVTDAAGDNYVAPEHRIAVFDNDGTLWAERPVYFQLLFAMDYLAQRAESDPDLLSSDALKAAAAGDMKALMAGGKEALIEVITVAHSGMSVDEFIAASGEWLRTAKHPETGKPYLDHVYQPMLELLRYLRDEGFETFIVSGGGVHMIRAFAKETYGIPPQNVIGSVGESEYQMVDGTPTIMKTPGIAFIDDKAGKPVGIDRHIGRRPVIAVGNSDGDFEMLEYATSGDGPRLAIIVHHTDAEREWAYDREGHVGKLVRGLDEGPDRGWLIVDMAQDWDRVWP